MKRGILLLGLAMVLMLSGCGGKEQPGAGGTRAGAGAQAADAPAAGATGGPQAGAEAPAAAAPKPAEAAQEADKPPVPGAGAQPQAAAGGQAEPKAAQAEADTPGAGAPSGPAGGTAAPAAAPPASQAAPAEAPALTIRITGTGERGVILKDTSVSFQDGTTVLDVLKQVVKNNKLQMEYQGKGAYAYVQGIDNLYEFDHGPKSGWVYKVNGQARHR